MTDTLNETPAEPYIYDWLRDRKARGDRLSHAFLRWVLSDDERAARKEDAVGQSRGSLPTDDAEMLDLLREMIEIWQEEF